MKIKSFSIFLIAIAAAGCNVGNAPPGMSETDAKTAIQNMKPEDRIRAINSSPMPGPQKEAEYKKIEEETGVKAADVLSGQVQAPGAGEAKL